MCREIEEQRYGRNKDTIVNFSYIESGEYRRKFDSISDNIKLNRLLYQLAKKMLKHRSGTLYEDMYWIDIDTGEIVASEVNQKPPGCCPEVFCPKEGKNEDCHFRLQWKRKIHIGKKTWRALQCSGAAF